MQKLSISLTGSIAGVDHGVSSGPVQSDIDLINKLDNPKKLSEKDVHIRQCWLTGDALMSRMIRFRTDDLPKMLELVNGAPVMEMHRTGGFMGLAQADLPVAKFFGGEIKTKNMKLIDGTMGDVSFIVPKFYWMQEHSGAEDMKLNIDGGIFSEASIGIRFEKHTCSVCSNDFRLCKHVPGETYSGQMAYDWLDNPVDVVEGSIVHRGAHDGTQFEQNSMSEDSFVKRVVTVRFGGELLKIGVPCG